MLRNVYRGDIYYADFDGAIGSEQKGIRPVLVLQNDIGNKYSPTTIVAPITTVEVKAKMPTHIFVKANQYGLKDDSYILMEQLRVIDKSRIKDYIGRINYEQMKEIEKAFLIAIGMKSTKVKVLSIAEVKEKEMTEDEMISYLKLAFYNLKHSGNTYLSVGLIIDYMYELMRIHDQDTIIEYVKKFTG